MVVWSQLNESAEYNIYLLQLGISTLGLDCALPSRFINLLPYKAWIGKYMIRSSIQIEKRVESIPNITKVNGMYQEQYRKSFGDTLDKNKTNLKQGRSFKMDGVTFTDDHNFHLDSMRIYSHDSLILKTSKNLWDTVNKWHA